MDGYGRKCYQSLTTAVTLTGAEYSAPVVRKPMTYSVEQDSHRALVYGALSNLFDRPPDRVFFEELAGSGFLDFMSDTSAVATDAFSDLDLEQLNLDYTRLFIGPGRHVPPFASVYRSGHGSGDLWDKTTGEVLRFMKHYGLSLSNPGAIPDHVSVLFEFMEKVILAKIKATEASVPRPTRKDAFTKANDIQKQFFSTYISSWIDEFLAAADQEQPPVFYQVVLGFTRDFIRQERLALEVDQHG